MREIARSSAVVAPGGQQCLPASPCPHLSPASPARLHDPPRRFLLTPGPADKPLCCKILRSGGGLLKGAPQYSLLVEQEGGRGGVFLVAARKRKSGPGGATYVLSVRGGRPRLALSVLPCNL